MLERADPLGEVYVDIYSFLLTVVAFLLLLNVVIGFQVQKALLVKSRVAIGTGRIPERRGQRRD